MAPRGLGVWIYPLSLPKQRVNILKMLVFAKDD